MKLMTIPRLELTAAVESVKTSKFLQKELQLDATEVFWSDSTVVLGYLKNEARRFHVFVANRVQTVRDHTEPSQWHHVGGEENPADEGSRGLYAGEMRGARWLLGPKFLWNNDFNVPVDPERKLGEDDPEVKAVHIAVAAETQNDSTLHLNHLSSWNSAKRAIATCRRVASVWLQRIRNRSTKLNSDIPVGPSPGLEDLKEAEVIILRSAQLEAFPEEVGILKTTQGTLPGRSHLSKLDPYLDDKGLLRVGGRIRSSDVPIEVKHPIVIPRKSHITTLVIRYCHERVHHQGRGITTNEIRSRGFWILGCSSAVGSYTFKCVVCRKLRARPENQKMADLPADRMTESPPFTYCGVDCFGPFIVCEGRRELKRYGVLFTCLASRAIHIEVANTMSTDSFINAMRRLISLRGPIRLLRCDRGTNFVGAKSEFQSATEEMDAKKIEKFMLSSGGEFQFCMNVPHASHMGGVWERMIRSARNVLSSLLESAGTQLNDDSLRTFMYEAAAIVNSRPLTTDNLYDPTSLKPLSPNDLLTMKLEVALPPPGNFPKEDLYSRKYWRRVQHLANAFWCRWRKEYIQTLQHRQKWTAPSRNIKIGDIVLIKDDLEPRGCWRLARVEETYASKDEHVRKVKLAVGNRNLDKRGRRTSDVTYLDRPVQQLVLLLEAEV